jgi:hypothetical protein
MGRIVQAQELSLAFGRKGCTGAAAVKAPDAVGQVTIEIVLGDLGSRRGGRSEAKTQQECSAAAE